MSNIIPFPTKPVTDHYFGGCPKCGGSDPGFNIGPNHWFVCHSHKTKWWTGSNLFSAWRDEDEATWLMNEIRFSFYREVEPIYPEPTEEEMRQRAECAEMHKRTREVDRGYGVRFENGTPVALGPDDDPFVNWP